MDVPLFSAILQHQAEQWDPSDSNLTGSPTGLSDYSRSCSVVPQGQSKSF